MSPLPLDEWVDSWVFEDDSLPASLRPCYWQISRAILKKIFRATLISEFEGQKQFWKDQQILEDPLILFERLVTDNSYQKHLQSKYPQIFTLLQMQKKRLLEVIEGDGYGWIEWASAKSNITHTDFYYEKIGGLLAVVYALAGVDFHYENIVASEYGPILVDLEGLMQPQLKRKRSEHTVLSSGFMPSVMWRGEAPHAEVSILGHIHQPSSHAQSLICGFKKIYELQLRNANQLISSTPFLKLSRAPSRIFFAHTENYFSVQSSLLSPNHLRSSKAWQQSLKSVSLKTTSSHDNSKDIIISSERRDLASLDIPYFYFDPKKRCIHDSQHKTIDQEIISSGAEVVRYRLLEKMNQEDLTRQEWFMNLSLECFDRTHFQRISQVRRLGGKSIDETYNELVTHFRKLVSPVGMNEPILLKPILHDQQWLLQKVDNSTDEFSLTWAVLDIVTNGGDSIALAKEVLEFSQKEKALKHEADVSLASGLAHYALDTALKENDLEKVTLSMKNLCRQLGSSSRVFGDGFRTERVDLCGGISGILLPLLVYNQRQFQ